MGEREFGREEGEEVLLGRLESRGQSGRSVKSGSIDGAVRSAWVHESGEGVKLDGGERKGDERSQVGVKADDQKAQDERDNGKHGNRDREEEGRDEEAHCRNQGVRLKVHQVREMGTLRFDARARTTAPKMTDETKTAAPTNAATATKDTNALAETGGVGKGKARLVSRPWSGT